MTPGYISQIERNLISPLSFRTDADCRGAEIPLVSLFTEEEEEQVTVIRKDKRQKYNLLISIWSISLRHQQE